MSNATTKATRAAALPLSLLLLPGVADACEIVRNKYLDYQGTCQFVIDVDRQDFATVYFAANQSQFELKFPNLNPRKFKYYVLGGSVEVYIDVRNIGTARAGTTEVAAMIQLMDPITGDPVGASINPPPARVPELAPNTEQRVYLATVYLPDPSRDYDIVAVGLVDPPTAALPLGPVGESNETDNSLSHTCHVFGPNAVSTPHPACD